MSQTNFTSEVQEALTKLMASMILADGRTEKAEVKDAQSRRLQETARNIY